MKKYNLILLTVFIFCQFSCSKDCDSGNTEKITRIVYVIPSDKTYNETYFQNLVKSATKIKNFYKNQTGKEMTYSKEIVEVLKANKNSDWFSNNRSNTIGTDYERNVVYNGRNYIEGNINCFNTDVYTYMVYVDAEGSGAGWKGICVMPAWDIRGLGAPDSNRWVGGSIHEWGHAYGLDHPSTTANTDVMSLGYLTYPNAYLNNVCVSLIINSPFFK
jgi:hypothetical protein